MNEYWSNFRAVRRLPRPVDRRRFLTRAAAAGAGLALGAAIAPKTAFAGSNSGFRWCSRCQNMWFAWGDDQGHCPVSHLWDHSHYQDGSAVYWFVDEQPEIGQDRAGMLGLKWCGTCKAAYFSFDRGVCPNNSEGHTPSAETYRIETDLQPPLSDFPKQPGWNRCTKCQVLYFGPNWIDSHCPAGDAHRGAAVDSGAGWRFEGYFPRIR
ncbi:twin-arginine translocation signal domain-containing protein [Nocardia beijingensis]|uniref:twin-arginine translocation signal domain-containing protein n=1 Tax=Nocardia beijingensis TaxID=95162 RepID=UPI0018941770|nr:twin-arginine translocation signal domain-containing protein [Nocardia beijingensis]MBF6076614.1 twin-arginine translocation signal domain-containing protein [Nocardia beijingensis]